MPETAEIITATKTRKRNEVKISKEGERVLYLKSNSCGLYRPFGYL